MAMPHGMNSWPASRAFMPVFETDMERSGMRGKRPRGPRATGILSLPAPRRAGEPLRLLGRAEQRLGLVDAFLLLGLRIGVGDDAGAGLHVHYAVLDQRGAQHDAAVELAGGGEIADRTGVEPALLLLQLVDDLHRPHLGRARDGAGRKARRQRVERVVFAVEVA